MNTKCRFCPLEVSGQEPYYLYPDRSVAHIACVPIGDDEGVALPLPVNPKDLLDVKEAV